MVTYLLKIFALLVFSFYIIFSYYSGNLHSETFGGLTTYFFIIIFFIACFFFFITFLRKEDGSLTFKFTGFNISIFFLLHLFVLCIYFFTLNGLLFLDGFILFFKILYFLFLPLFILIISYGTGLKIFSFIDIFNDQDKPFKIVSSLSLGLVLYITLLSIFGFIGIYNIFSFIFLTIIFLLVGYTNIEKTTKFFFYNTIYKFSIDPIEEENNYLNNLQSYSYFFSSIFLFIVITFLLSVNFINIVRPMPIGWDDMGVYMNYPQQIALAGSNIMYGGMIAWQSLTGIGFLFKSNVQAFFLNNIGALLSVLFLSLISYDIFKSYKKTFINLSLLLPAIFLAIPMVVFQQAKDMKLDIGLFAISIAGIYMFYYIFSKYIGIKNDNELNTFEISYENNGEKDVYESYTDINSDSTNDSFFNNIGYLILFFIVGLIIGFTFSVKLTSLMTILALIGVIFYGKLGITGLFGYLSIFIAVFTKLHLWDKLNVVYPKDDLAFINSVFYSGLFLSILFFSVSIHFYKSSVFKKTIVLLVLFLSGIITILSPWFIKNIFQAQGNITINRLLSGKSDYFIADYSDIYTEAELNSIKEQNSIGLNNKGTTNHEDLGRYFGYEEGINNYIKLPWNLTMQVNQPGEYTDITYIFLALVPLIFLFLSYKNNYYSVFPIFIGILIFLLFSLYPLNLFFTYLFTLFNLPSGYLILFLFFLIPTLYYLLTLDNGKLSNFIKLNIVFTFFYTFLWSISAYGIVWYGISMYFGFLIFILFGGYFISLYDEYEEEKNNLIRFFGSILFLFIISIYFIKSAFPHGFNNIKSASYSNYKNSSVTQAVGIFETHNRYLPILSELNLSSNKGELFEKIIFNNDLSNNKFVYNLIKTNVQDFSNVSLVNDILTQLYEDNSGKIPLNKVDIFNIKDELYKNVLYPPKGYSNTDGIYRIGTFLKYFTFKNYNRMYEDNLINNFDNYIYSFDDSITIDRLEKLGLKYLLVDLNAATIDKDPRHDLTRRYENLLDTFKSDKLELVETDSMCLKIALEDYKKDTDYDKFIFLSGVNYDSYIKNENGDEMKIDRRNKQMFCYEYIFDLINNNKISKESYPYLLEIYNYVKYLKSNGSITSDKEVFNLLSKYANHGWFTLFKIK